MSASEVGDGPVQGVPMGRGGVAGAVKTGAVKAATAAVLSVVMALALVLLTACSGGSGGGFEGADAGRGTPPAVEREPGAVITQMELAVESPSVESARRIVYASRDAHGGPAVVSGSVLEPTAQWTGDGPRPLLVIAPGTQGAADNCAPSMTMHFGTAPPPPSRHFLDLGWAVAITDYQGLGTPGPHTYLVREAQGNAVLDVARAAQDLLGGGGNLDAAWAPSSEVPIAVFGFSQGGAASAAAAELAADYAPELDIRAVYAGGVPVDLQSTAEEIDGSALSGAMGYAINGLVAAYPEIRAGLDAMMNDEGRRFLRDTATQCIGATLAMWGRRDSSDFTADGRSFAEHLGAGAGGGVGEAVDKQRLGTVAPGMPVFVTHNVQDDVIPVAGARRLVREWCGGGANVTYAEVDEDLGDASHGLAWQLTADEAFGWLVSVMGGPDAPGAEGTC
ncbi:lipase family protein [Corynebacterium sp. NPDC060344]|uniref:lipase family protein n=1 Tax=Corynebacterium sp. NPDC060344 TaxID=3347101 RepID=UPI0036599830